MLNRSLAKNKINGRLLRRHGIGPNRPGIAASQLAAAMCKLDLDLAPPTAAAIVRYYADVDGAERGNEEVRNDRGERLMPIDRLIAEVSRRVKRS